MKVTNVYQKGHRTSEQKESERKVRTLFENWKPGPEELVASGRWSGPVNVQGQQEFWEAIRRVRASRQAQGLTLKDVSERCGIDVATLSKLETGKQVNPTLFTMLLYVGAVGKRLQFAVRDNLPPTIRVEEIREVTPKTNGTAAITARRLKGRTRVKHR